MASFKDVLEIESKRETKPDCMKAFLFREGNFFRAYEWSAWLFFKHVYEFKVTCNMVKSLGQTLVFIGFPQTSAGKYIASELKLTPVSDNMIEVAFPPSKIGEEKTVEAMREEFKAWKEAIPVSEKPAKSKEGETNAFSVDKKAAPQTLTQIMQKILAYSIESKSPLDSMAFLAEVKQQLSSLI